MTKYQVTYASAGCLPENEPEVFDTLEAASIHVVTEFDAVAAELEARGVECDVITGFDVIPNMGAQDPTPGSLYRWTIERVRRVEDSPAWGHGVKS